jgi:hypothetical protein
MSVKRYQLKKLDSEPAIMIYRKPFDPIAAYDVAIQDPAFAKRAIGKYTRTTNGETLDATYKETVKDYALRIPYVSLAGLTSILEFGAEMAVAAKKLALEKIFDNSLLQEIQKEMTK